MQPAVPHMFAAADRRDWFTPSVLELLVLALAGWLIGFTIVGDATGMGLLGDSQTGYHIRVGEYVLAHGAVPDHDFLSFTRPNEPFYAWEWLSGIFYAWLNQWSGLRGIVVVSAVLVGISVLVTLRHMAWRGANLLLIVALIHLGISASSLHYLARPHVFTLLFLAIALRLLDQDRRAETKWLWALIPLTTLWTNLHGGFFALLVSLGILTCGSAAEAWFNGKWSRVWRWSLLTLGCFLASLLNPYGISEHLHLVQFMQETWYLKLTEEYQAPVLFSSESAYYTILLGLGIAASLRLLWNKQFAWALLTLAWAYASAKSMRHIPLYVIVTMPMLAEEGMRFWNRWVDGKSRRSVPGLLQNIAGDYQASLQRSSLFLPVVYLALLLFPLGIAYPQDFPEAVYPAVMVKKHEAAIGQARVFTSDGWGHYLTYRFPAPYLIYIDGRTDFFGERFTQEYLDTLRGETGWAETLDRNKVDMVLLPPDSGVVPLLRSSAHWKLVDESDMAVLFSKR